MKSTCRNLLAGAIALLAFTSTSNAQVSVSASVNIGTPTYSYYLPATEYYYAEPRRVVYVNDVRSIYYPVRYERAYRPAARRVVVERPRYRTVRYVNYSRPRYRSVRYVNYHRSSYRPVVVRNSFYRAKGHPHGMPPGQARNFYGGGWGHGGGRHGHGRH